MKKIISVFAIFILALLAVNCEQQAFDLEDDFVVPDNGNIALSRSVSTQLNWKDRLKKIMETPPTLLTESEIALLGYEVVDIIDDKVKLDKYKLAVKKDDNMIPYYTTLDKVEAISKSRAKTIRSKNVEYTFSEGDAYIDSVTNLGMKVLRLKWSNKGVVTNTLCIVSEKEGIVYDNFLSNTVIFSCDTTCTVEYINNIIPRLKSGSEGGEDMDTTVFNPGGGGGTGVTPPSYYKKLEWKAEAKAEWLSGSDYGYARIYHTGYYENDIFSYHKFHAESYISTGNHDSRVEALDSRTVTYAYALSARSYKITIGYEGKYLTAKLEPSGGRDSFKASGQHPFGEHYSLE